MVHFNVQSHFTVDSSGCRSAPTRPWTDLQCGVTVGTHPIPSGEMASLLECQLKSVQLASSSHRFNTRPFCASTMPRMPKEWNAGRIPKID